MMHHPIRGSEKFPIVGKYSSFWRPLLLSKHTIDGVDAGLMPISSWKIGFNLMTNNENIRHWNQNRIVLGYLTIDQTLNNRCHRTTLFLVLSFFCGWQFWMAFIFFIPPRQKNSWAVINDVGVGKKTLSMDFTFLDVCGLFERLHYAVWICGL